METNPIPQTEKKNNQKTIIWVVVAVLLCCFCVAAGVAGWYGYQAYLTAQQVVEAFRTIRLNVTHMLGSSAGPVSLTISSASPGDGKSLVAANLALSFAESGYKVCLMDGDIRRGELHRSFGVERKPGLLDALAGTAQLEHILRSGGQ